MEAPKIAKSDFEIERCFGLMVELRPNLRRETFLATVREMESEGYRLAYIETGGMVTCLAGFRVSTNLFHGKNLYVDDLVSSSSHRSNGLGSKMVSWLRTFAIERGCAYMHLDTGIQRNESQRFYFNQGMQIVAYHFSEQLARDS